MKSRQSSCPRTRKAKSKQQQPHISLRNADFLVQSSPKERSKQFSLIYASTTGETQTRILQHVQSIIALRSCFLQQYTRRESPFFFSMRIYLHCVFFRTYEEHFLLSDSIPIFVCSHFHFSPLNLCRQPDRDFAPAIDKQREREKSSLMVELVEQWEKKKCLYISFACLDAFKNQHNSPRDA